MDAHGLLQAICRHYLNRLRDVAARYGLEWFVDETIEMNKQGRCSGSEEEAEMLARLCDDERLSRRDIPKLMHKSYRQCNEDGTFNSIKKLKHVGTYSKINTLLKQKQL